MPAYKDKERNTWYVSFKYKDYTGNTVSGNIKVTTSVNQKLPLLVVEDSQNLVTFFYIS